MMMIMMMLLLHDDGIASEEILTVNLMLMTHEPNLR